MGAADPSSCRRPPAWGTSYLAWSMSYPAHWQMPLEQWRHHCIAKYDWRSRMQRLCSGVAYHEAYGWTALQTLHEPRQHCNRARHSVELSMIADVADCVRAQGVVERHCHNRVGDAGRFHQNPIWQQQTQHQIRSAPLQKDVVHREASPAIQPHRSR